MAQKGSTVAVAVAAAAIVDPLNVLHEIEIDMFAGPRNSTAQHSTAQTSDHIALIIVLWF